MSVRLNKGRREFIVRRVLAAAFEKKVKAAEAKVNKDFPKFRKTLLGKHAKAYDSLPTVWRRGDQRSAFTLQLPSGNTVLKLKELVYIPIHFGFAAVRRKSGEYAVEMSLHWNKTAADYYEGHEAALDVLRPSLVELITLLEEQGVMEAEVEAVVNSVSTEKRLYEIWPELAEIVPPSDGEKRGTALTVNIDKLNEKIPLPQKKPA